MWYVFFWRGGGWYCNPLYGRQNGYVVGWCGWMGVYEDPVYRWIGEYEEDDFEHSDTVKFGTLTSITLKSVS